jgi:hypothetical protein
MKNDSIQPLSIPASREKRDIWDQFRHDHELIERLRITPTEMDSLAKCSLLGTLTCKQDLLFILRQIREATGTPPTVFASAPVSTHEDKIDEPMRDLSRIRGRLAPSLETLSAGSIGGIVERRGRGQFGVAFWAVILTAGVVWNLALVFARWHGSYLSKIGLADAQAPQSEAWYTRIDNFKLLISFEGLFVIVVMAVLYFLSRRRPRRLKVKPI